MGISISRAVSPSELERRQDGPKPGPSLIAVLVTALLLGAMSAEARSNGDSRVAPATDPQNSEGWALVEAVSDEFEADRLDESKWLIQGRNGEYRSNFIGRAPSQFSTNNVRLESGMLKLQSRWDPGFDFSPKIDYSDKKAENGRRYENITSAAVISKTQVLYGYFEIKCKAAPASVTSSFWMTGNQSELDVFEFSGRPKQRHKVHLESELWSSIHDWSKPGGPTTWTDRLQLGWKVADGFHVYALEWDSDYLKFYADGELVREVSKQDVGEEGWVIDKPVWVWVDSEVFPWHGIPEKEDLPVDYEIEYLRVWQKHGQQSAGGGLLGFERPAGDSKDWWIPTECRDHLSIVEGKAATGDRSLKFVQRGALPRKVTAFSPYGSVSIDEGEQTLSLKVRPGRQSSLKRLRVVLEEPWKQLPPFELEGLSPGEWTTLSQTFRRGQPSGVKDRVRIVVEPEDAGRGRSAVDIDDLVIESR